MRPGQVIRGFSVAFTVLAVAVLMPLAVAADAPTTRPDLRYVITRLGDQAPTTAPRTTTTSTSPTTSSVHAFRFTAQGQITVSGTPGTVKLAMNGEYAMPNRLHATVTVTGPDSSQQIAPVELVVVGQTPYVHLTGSNSPTGKDVWVLIDNPGGAATMPGVNLPNLANLPPPSTQTQTLGDETINGIPTTHTRTTIDATAILGGTAKGAKSSTLTLDLWTGKSDNFPRRLTVNGNLSIDRSAVANLVGGPAGATASAANVPPVDATLIFTMDFTDPNAPVTITAPTTYVKLSDLLKQ